MGFKKVCILVPNVGALALIQFQEDMKKQLSAEGKYSEKDNF